MRNLFATFTLIALAGSVLAQPTINGVFTPADGWGAARALQDTNTQFGNASGPNTGNELDGLFITSDASNLYVGLTGNIQDNNGIVVFLDTRAGGSLVLNTDPGLANCPNSQVPTLIREYSGSDLDLLADYSFLISVGIFPGQSSSQLVMACDITDLVAKTNVPLGIGFVNGGSTLSASANTGVVVGSDNSNAIGVGDYGVSPTPVLPGEDPSAVTTGFEIKIPRSLIGLGPNSTLFAFANLTNNANDGGGCFRTGYASNQSLPGVGGLSNLGPFSSDGPFLPFSLVTGTQAVGPIAIP